MGGTNFLLVGLTAMLAMLTTQMQLLLLSLLATLLLLLLLLLIIRLQLTRVLIAIVLLNDGGLGGLHGHATAAATLQCNLRVCDATLQQISNRVAGSAVVVVAVVVRLKQLLVVLVQLRQAAVARDRFAFCVCVNVCEWYDELILNNDELHLKSFFCFSNTNTHTHTTQTKPTTTR